MTNVYKPWSGYLQEVKNAAGGASLWLATAVSPSGRVTNETLGNNLTVTRTYNSADRLTRILTSGVQDDNYSYDLIGNLTQRIDAIHSVTENLGYDRLNRLTSASIPAHSPPLTIATTYNAIGNIQTKSDVGAYAYPSSGAGSVRPHAVTGVSPYSGGIQATYGYDANGNMISVTNGTVWSPNGQSSMTFNRSLSYMSFNLPNVIEDTQNGWWYTSYTYTYGADHERVKLVTNKPDDLIHSVYVHPNNSGALLYERDSRPMAGTVEHKYYVTGLGGLVGVYSVKSASQYGMLYYHKDRLNSIVAITNQAGGIEDPLAYEAYGERRYTDGTQQNRTGTIIGLLTDRGFTSHEHLDEINLIHMNGRMYDPALGRFITPDPFVQFAGNPQSYNRYSYGLDNPLMYTDPSGYKIKLGNIFKAAVIAVAAVYTGGAAYTAYMGSAIFSAGGAMAITGAQFASASLTASIMGGATGGFTAGFLASGGDLQAGMTGAAGGALMGGVNGYFGDNWNLQRVGANSLAGGLSSTVSGGTFAAGFQSNFLTSTAKLGWDFARDDTDALKFRSSENGGDLLVYNDHGELLTDGTRNTKPGPGFIDRDKWNPMLKLIGDVGMNPEGAEHIYSGAPWVARFFNWTSKVHDFLNQWGYDKVDGFRVMGSPGYEAAFNVYSFAGMAPAAAFTAAARSAGPATEYLRRSLR